MSRPEDRSHGAYRVFPISRRLLPYIAVAAPFLAVADTAVAQFSGAATLVSDYRYRGVSFSQGNPEAQLAVGYDSPAGWYAGGLTSGVNLDGTNSAQFVAYGGYSGRLSAASSWEVGASNSCFSRASLYDYKEAYVGLTSENFSGRVYYSPSYLNQQTRTVYGEFNASYALRENVDLLGHVGVLHALSDNDVTQSEPGSRFDGKVGISVRVADWVAELAGVALQKKAARYPGYEDRNPRAVVLSISYSF